MANRFYLKKGFSRQHGFLEFYRNHKAVSIAVFAFILVVGPWIIHVINNPDEYAASVARAKARHELKVKYSTPATPVTKTEPADRKAAKGDEVSVTDTEVPEVRKD
ncbi:hypothetical protein [Ruminobacter amylophilus]|uniref:hypothetical protein n=1 Tax=Ruminobacter amylophilus TaxID=867 RepID=UPI003869860A